MRRFLIVFHADVWEQDGVVSPVALKEPRYGIYAWGLNADDALRRAEDSLASLIAAEAEGAIMRRGQ